ncbi:MAG: hypothetical protein AAF251_07970 [Pseudomonadota bacterium]
MIRFGLGCVVLAISSPALAQWQYMDAEGAYYAWVTDGGFVEGSFENGLNLFCPDVSGPEGQHRRVLCEFSVTIAGAKPTPPAAVSFTFSDGLVVKRRVEAVQGGPSQIALEGELLDRMLSDSGVTVAVASGESFTFSLEGSSHAIRKAMDL